MLHREYFQGSDDYYKNYHAEEIKDSIDKAVSEEADHKSPNGYLTQPYSIANWNKYWNSRIYYLYELGGPGTPSSYKGPTGQEFIKYIIQSRAKAGLPQLELEERNISRVPQA